MVQGDVAALVTAARGRFNPHYPEWYVHAEIQSLYLIREAAVCGQDGRVCVDGVLAAQQEICETAPESYFEDKIRSQTTTASSFFPHGNIDVHTLFPLRTRRRRHGVTLRSSSPRSVSKAYMNYVGPRNFLDLHQLKIASSKQQ